MKKKNYIYLAIFILFLNIFLLINICSFRKESVIDYKSGIIKYRYYCFLFKTCEERPTGHIFSTFPIPQKVVKNNCNWQVFNKQLLMIDLNFSSRDPFAPTPFGVAQATWQLGYFFFALSPEQADKIRNTFLQKLNSEGEKEAISYAYKKISEMKNQSKLFRNFSEEEGNQVQIHENQHNRERQGVGNKYK